MKKLSLLPLCITALMLMGTLAWAQTGFYLVPDLNSPGNPGGYNEESEGQAHNTMTSLGWTLVIDPSGTTPVWSSLQTMPFTINIGDSNVNQYKISSTGVITFTTEASAVPGETNEAIPSQIFRIAR